MQDFKRIDELKEFLISHDFKEVDMFAVKKNNIVVLMVSGIAYISNIDIATKNINCNMSIEGDIDEVKQELMGCIDRVSKL